MPILSHPGTRRDRFELLRPKNDFGSVFLASTPPDPSFSSTEWGKRSQSRASPASKQIEAGSTVGGSKVTGFGLAYLSLLISARDLANRFGGASHTIRERGFHLGVSQFSCFCWSFVCPALMYCWSGKFFCAHRRPYGSRQRQRPIPINEGGRNLKSRVRSSRAILEVMSISWIHATGNSNFLEF